MRMVESAEIGRNITFLTRILSNNGNAIKVI